MVREYGEGVMVEGVTVEGVDDSSGVGV